MLGIWRTPRGAVSGVPALRPNPESRVETRSRTEEVVAWTPWVRSPARVAARVRSERASVSGDSMCAVETGTPGPRGARLPQLQARRRARPDAGRRDGRAASTGRPCRLHRSASGGRPGVGAGNREASPRSRLPDRVPDRRVELAARWCAAKSRWRVITPRPPGIRAFCRSASTSTVRSLSAERVSRQAPVRDLERPQDTPRLLQELVAAMAGPAVAGSPIRPAPTGAGRRAAAAGVCGAAPVPGGASTSTISGICRARPTPRRLSLAAQPGQTLTIKGPRQMGKSSLLMRTVKAGTRSAANASPSSIFSSSTKPRRPTRRCSSAASRRPSRSSSSCPTRSAEQWDAGFSNPQNCTRYVEQDILQSLKAP